MASEPPTSAPPAGPEPPKPPGPGATRDEWRAWRHQQRRQTWGQWPGGSYGPWAWGGGGGWPWFWGAALILIGAYYLLQNLGLLNWLRGDVLWPLLLILLGVLLLVQRGRHSSH
jgi:LiaI-LiaF-like transmembrane region